LTNVLAGPAPRPRKGTSTHDTYYIQPGYEHAHVLFNKSADLIKYYKEAAHWNEQGRQGLITDHLEALEKDKNDAAEMLHAGQELARRRIQQVLKTPEDQTSASKKTEPLFTSEKLDDVASMFKVLRDESKEDMEGVESEEVIRVDMADGQGLFPLIKTTKKGVKKLAGHLFVQEE
jgi:hypothetical protein